MARSFGATATNASGLPAEPFGLVVLLLLLVAVLLELRGFLRDAEGVGSDRRLWPPLMSGGGCVWIVVPVELLVVVVVLLLVADDADVVVVLDEADTMAGGIDGWVAGIVEAVDVADVADAAAGVCGAVNWLLHGQMCGRTTVVALPVFVCDCRPIVVLVVVVEEEEEAEAEEVVDFEADRAGNDEGRCCDVGRVVG